MTRILRPILLLAICLCALGVRDASALDLARQAEIELRGPLSNVVVQAQGGGRTHVEGELASGETRVVVVPLAQPDGSSTHPTITFDADPDPSRAAGSARFVRWREASSLLEKLSPGLRARARPALAETVVEISRAAPLVLLVAAIVVVFLRRRPYFALVVGLAAAAALYPLVRAPVRDLEASVTLVDGDVEAGVWRRVDAALDLLTLAPGADVALECDPPGAHVIWYVALDRTRPARVRAPGTRLLALGALEVGEGALAREKNGYAAFEEVWLREGGEWKRVGNWDFGAPLPAARAEGAPPAWLASGLPQGIPILIARERGSGSRSAVWVRVAGL